MKQLRIRMILSLIWLSFLSTTFTVVGANSYGGLDECKTLFEADTTAKNNNSSLIGIEVANDGLPNYRAGQTVVTLHPNGQTHTQHISSLKNLAGPFTRLARRMRALSQAPHLETGFREVGAFVFEFENNKFQIVLNTLNKTDIALDNTKFLELFTDFTLIDLQSRVKKIYYLHTHPDITDFRIQKYLGANPDPGQSRAAGLPWESTIILSLEDMEGSINIKNAFDTAFKRKIPFEIIVLPTISRFDQIYFSYTPQ